MLRAGFAKLDITPPLDCGLLGYDFRQKHLPPGATHVNDPLHARVLVIDDGQALTALATVDLCIIFQDTGRHLRKSIAETIGTTTDRVIIACSHTHSGPYVAGLHEVVDRDIPGTDGGVELTDAERAYPEQLDAKLVEAAERAAGKMFPVVLSHAQAPLGLAYNRRVRTDDGVAMCWCPQEQVHLDPGSAADPTCGVLVAEQVGGPRRFVIYNIGAHSTVLGKTSRAISADWPGAACRYIEQNNPNTQAMFLFGACGDAHPWIATQDDPRGCEIVGHAAGSFVTMLTHATRPVPAIADQPVDTMAKTVKIGAVAVDLAAWRLGPVVVLAMPVELFGALAMDLRSRVDRPVMLATVANGFLGYWPTRAAFEDGDYEVEAAIANGREPEHGEQLIDEAVRLIQSLG